MLKCHVTVCFGKNYSAAFFLSIFSIYFHGNIGQEKLAESALVIENLRGICSYIIDLHYQILTVSKSLLNILMGLG